jgi:hypothetical protein
MLDIIFFDRYLPISYFNFNCCCFLVAIFVNIGLLNSMSCDNFGFNFIFDLFDLFLLCFGQLMDDYSNFILKYLVVSDLQVAD